VSSKLSTPGGESEFVADALAGEDGIVLVAGLFEGGEIEGLAIPVAEDFGDGCGGPCPGCHGVHDAQAGFDGRLDREGEGTDRFAERQPCEAGDPPFAPGTHVHFRNRVGGSAGAGARGGA